MSIGHAPPASTVTVTLVDEPTRMLPRSITPFTSTAVPVTLQPAGRRFVIVVPTAGPPSGSTALVRYSVTSVPPQ